MKIRPVGAELFHADRDGQTDVRTNTKKLIVAPRTIADAPENDDRSVVRSRTGVWPTSSDELPTSVAGRPAYFPLCNTALW